MTKTYTITLSDTQAKAFEYDARSVQQWIQYAAEGRANIAVDEIVNLAIQKFLELGQSIPGNKDDIIAAAFENGWVQTAEDRQAVLDANTL